MSALTLPRPQVARAVATPILATGRYLLSDPNFAVGLSAILGAAALELTRSESQSRRVVCALVAAASPMVVRSALGAVLVKGGIDAAKVSTQAMVDTAVACIAGTSVALVSLLFKAPWASGDTLPPIETHALPRVMARLLLAALMGPIVFHTVMATAPLRVRQIVCAATYCISPAFTWALHHL